MSAVSRALSSKNWQWCTSDLKPSDVDNERVRTVYRLDTTPVCSYGDCKCKSNVNKPEVPFCLNGLGEKRLAQALLKESTNNLVDRNALFRKPDEYVGLTNLGATCYINAYLQVWFSNIFFRENILGIKFDRMELLLQPEETIDENNLESVPKHQLYEFLVKPSECLATNLQLVFTLMKETVRKCINPEFFVKAIGLDASEQQDAQEFSQLFLTTLQNTLSTANLSNRMQLRFPLTFLSKDTNKASSCSSPKNLINDLFQGECSYITKCHKCKQESVRHSKFVELSLNIQNSKDIIECIDELIKDEILDGDNKYHCGECKSKQNATRRMRLTRLPPVLNLQLLRFVYDRKSETKKKLSSRIKFFEEIDLSEYTDGEDTSVYHLGAILMHVGKTAYSGHYTAQIRDFSSNEWNTFNDMLITRVKKQQQLGCADDDTESAADVVIVGGSPPPNNSPDDVTTTTKTATAASSKGNEPPPPPPQQPQPTSSKSSSNNASSSAVSKTFSTANAYLLVYYRSDLLDAIIGGGGATREKLAAPSNQSDVIRMDNERLLAWARRVDEHATRINDVRFIERSVRHQIYETLWVNDLPSTEFNSNMKQFLQQDNPNRVYPIRGYLSNKQKSLDPHKDFFFIPTEIIKKLLADEHSSGGGLAASLAAVSDEVMSKYMCAHKRLNPFAISRFKIVSRRGIDKARRELGLDWISTTTTTTTTPVCLPCYDESTTLCWECVFACYDYVRVREQTKVDAREVKTLLEKEYTGNDDDDDDGREPDDHYEDDRNAAETNNVVDQAVQTTQPMTMTTPSKKKSTKVISDVCSDTDDVVILEDSKVPSRHKNGLGVIS